MKPGWPKCHPWLCRHRLGEGNQPPQQQNDPGEMLKVMSWGYIRVKASSAFKAHQLPCKGLSSWAEGPGAPSLLPPCLSFPFVKLGEIEMKETPSLLLCLRTFLWLCCGVGSSSTSLGGEGDLAVVLMLIHVSLYISLPFPPCQSAAPVAVQRLLQRGLESRTSPSWDLCAGREAMLGAQGIRGSFWAAAPILEAQPSVSGQEVQAV